MSSFLHGLISITYTVLAVAVGLYAAETGVGGDPAFAALAAFAVLIGAAFLHLSVSQQRRNRVLTAELHGVHLSQNALEATVTASRDEMHRLVNAFEDATRKIPGPTCSDLVAEMRMMQSVLQQLSPPPEAVARTLEESDAGAPALANANADEVLSVIRDALQNNRVDVYLQPVVSLPQRKTAFYETFTRLRARDDAVIEPAQYLEVASKAGLMTAIDNNLLFRSIQLVRKTHRHNLNYGLFCNISPYTLRDTSFFPEFIEFMAHNIRLAASLIFEFSQADLEGHDDYIARNLGRLSAMGFRFSIDQVTTLDLDIGELRDRHVSFIKIEAATLLESVRDPQADLQLHRLKRTFDRSGIALIVEKVEAEEQIVELLEFGFDFGQGYLFGEPRLSKTGA